MKDCNNLLLELNANASAFNFNFNGRYSRGYYCGKCNNPEDLETEIYYDNVGANCQLVGTFNGYETTGYKNTQGWSGKFIIADLKGLKITPTSIDNGFRWFKNPQICKEFIERGLEEEEKYLLRRKATLLREYCERYCSGGPQSIEPEDLGIYNYKEIVDMYNNNKLPEEFVLSILRLGKRFNLLENVAPIECSLTSLTTWRGAKLVTNNGNYYYPGSGYYSFRNVHRVDGKIYYNEGWALFRTQQGAYAWRRSIIKRKLEEIDERINYIKLRRESANRDLIVFN